ncbi:MAG: ABC transporter ATP-binding protein [Erysipelotrichales bacterium]|nr:ABC transporter ATP-binding protein [Erysipelotrichales bacterium]
MNVIEVKNLIKKFDSKKVIDNISFDVEAGKIFGFLGPSGAGKTTLIKILIGEYTSTKGLVKVFDKEPKDYNDEITNGISAVMDNFGLYERLTVYENLEVFANIYKTPKSEINSILKKVELFDSKNKVVSKLSKGMKQRLLLARALVNNPKLLFLDEPTSGLDPATSLKIHNLLFELKTSGTTIFLTTHNMEEATKMCDTVALLHLGKIVEFGTPKDICMRHNEDNDIKIINKQHKEIILKNSKANASKISKMFQEEDILSIHSSEPTLESVFIKLTGKELV